MENLFIQPTLEFEKVAAGATMPEDPNMWPSEILEQLFKQAPYMTDFFPHVVMDRVDGERGYAFGHIEVLNQSEVQPGLSEAAQKQVGVRQVRVPVVIQNNILSPFDLLITEDSKILPLTEARLRAAIFRPQAFDITGKMPGDQSILGQLYPPYRQNYGGGGSSTPTGEMGKSSSVLEAILPTINVSDLENFKDAVLNDDNMKMAYEKNAAATFSAVRTLLEHEPRGKVASAIAGLVNPTVVQVSRVNDGYCVKEASHVCWEPQMTTVDRATVVKDWGDKVALAADTTGTATLTEGVEPKKEAPEEPQMVPITEPGVYTVQGEDGKALVGHVFPKLIDTEGTEVPIALFTNNKQSAIQTDIVGLPAEEQIELAAGAAPEGKGFFVGQDAGGLKATVPMTLTGSYQDAQPDAPVVSKAQTFDGQQVEVSVQPNIQSVVGSPDRMLVPQNWQWVPLGEDVSLASAEPELDKGASARLRMGSVEIVASGGGNSYSLRGLPIDKLAHDEREFLDYDDTQFLLAGLGVHPAKSAQKMASAVVSHGPVQVEVGRFIKTADEQKQAAVAAAQKTLGDYPTWRRSLIKEAAVISDPDAVDTVLSLGFINPENLVTFIGYLPELDESQMKLCEILMATRLGMSEVPEDAVTRSVRTLEEVLVGLKTLAFQGPGDYS